MAIQTAAGIGMAVISSEHFFSTFLSSPWTTEKFAESEEDKAKVRKLYWIAVACSLVTAIILSIILKQWWPLVSAIILCVIYYATYERAMGKGI